ncbi:MAG TPA: DUF1801 domain-containing protein [Halalkalibaculum sp.]|nr:DUF1801 domain-containing protein [Halalkalibaculum sp.]
MSALKTQQNEGNVIAFLNAVEEKQKREDSLALLDIMKEASGEEPKMWGPSIVGFGKYHYKYESGREGNWFLTGFSPRKQKMSVYIVPGFERFNDLIARLGKYSTGKSCLYFKKLTDIDCDILSQLIRESVEYMKKKYS